MWGSLWRKSHRMGKLQPWPAALNKDGGRRTLLICFFVFLPVSVLVFLEQMVSSAAVTHLGWACVCMREYAVISSWSPSWLSNRSWRGWCVGDREPGHTHLMHGCSVHVPEFLFLSPVNFQQQAQKQPSCDIVVAVALIGLYGTTWGWPKELRCH